MGCLMFKIFAHLPLILICFILLLQDVSSKSKSMTPFEKKMKTDSEVFRKTKCAHLAGEFNPVCVNYYLNPKCFVQVYGPTGPEFGEYLNTKDKEFTECHKKS